MDHERKDERLELHTDYLDSLKQKKASKGLKSYSPAGSYIIDCKEIEEQWPDEASDLSLDIRQTREPGVFEASFDFGILEEVMIISADKNALAGYCSQPDDKAESESDEDEDEVENDRKPTTGSKRARRGKPQLLETEVAH